MEVFGSIEDVARAKAELIEALPENGMAVLNADDPRVAAMAGERRAPWSPTAEDRAVATCGPPAWWSTTNCARVLICAPPGARAGAPRGPGRHQVTNAVAAAACGLALGVGIDEVVDRLSTVLISGHRMWLVRGPSGVIVLDDSYNANPTSTRAALDALAALPVDRTGSRSSGSWPSSGSETGLHPAGGPRRVARYPGHQRGRAEYGRVGTDAVPT